ncbi:PAS domain-containing protein [Thermoproteota archaeon]
MIKKAIFKIPLQWKFFLLLIGVMVLLGASYYYWYYEVFDFLKTTAIDQHTLNYLRQITAQVYVFTCVLLLIGICGFYYDIRRFLMKINKAIKDALKERNLETSFDDFYTGRSYEDLSSNINALFALFKSFDTMKVAQVTLESNSIKILLNNIDEGVLLVNREKIVSHANHPAETMFRLIPGEVIGQSISRKINNELILESLNTVLEKGDKVTEQIVEISEGKFLSVDIQPVKDKFGEVIRALILLKTAEAPKTK